MENFRYKFFHKFIASFAGIADNFFVGSRFSIKYFIELCVTICLSISIRNNFTNDVYGQWSMSSQAEFQCWLPDHAWLPALYSTWWSVYKRKLWTDVEFERNFAS